MNITSAEIYIVPIDLDVIPVEPSTQRRCRI